MKKSNKIMAFAIIGVFGALVSMAGVSATSIGFSSNVPKYQNYAYVPAKYKSESSGTSTVSLSVLKVDAVTFSVCATGHSYGNGSIVSHINDNITVDYDAIYGVGQQVQARYRNHNWSSSYTAINGVYNYR